MVSAEVAWPGEDSQLPTLIPRCQTKRMLHQQKETKMRQQITQKDLIPRSKAQIHTEAAPPDSIMISIKGFIHCYAINNWRSVLRQQLAYIQRSGLSGQTTEITIVILSSFRAKYQPPRHYSCPIRVQVITPQEPLANPTTLDLAESHTLLEIYLASLHQKGNEEQFIWYIHGKGVSRYKDPSYINAANWRKLCESIVIGKHRECIDLLLTKDIDACGPLLNSMHHWPHFSGNFWWTRSSYVRTLSHPFKYAVEFAEREKMPMRWAAEAWILSARGRTANMFYIEEALKDPWLYGYDLRNLLIKNRITPEQRTALGFEETWRKVQILSDRLQLKLARSRQALMNALKHAIKKNN